MVLKGFLKAAALLLFVSQCAQAAVLGIDFGAEHIKASIVAPKKPFKIILDASSKRKWKGVVGFPDDTSTFRLFGNDAKSRVTRRPRKTFYNLQEALGRTLESDDIARFEKGYLPYEFIQDETRNTTAIRYDEEVYSVEELVAMIFGHIKDLSTVENDGIEVRDVVITVPDFFSHKQRAAIWDAAEIANFNVLSLIDENTAVACQYGIEKTYEKNEMWKDENAEIYAFYNMGHQSTKVSLVRYSAYKQSGKIRGQFEVLTKTWDAHLGGFDFDMILTNRLLEEARDGLAAQGMSAPEEDARVMAKIKQAANKAKFVLSSNKEKRVNIEGLYKDFDFRSQVISRETFVELSQDLLDRVLDPLDRAMENAGLDKENLKGLVLMGGSVRIPRIKEMLTEWAGDVEIKKDINGDEAAATGAAFRAANMSTTFRVRPIGMTDITPFAISVRLHDLPKKDSSWMSWLTGAQDNKEPTDEAVDEPADDDEKIFSKRGTLYKIGSKIGKRKAVAFKHSKDLRVELKYDDVEQLPSGTTDKLGVYKVTGVEDAVLKYPDLDEPKVKLTFVVDQSGMVNLVKGIATFIEEKEVQVRKTPAPTPKPETPAPTEAEEKPEGEDGEAAVEEEEGEGEGEAATEEEGEGETAEGEGEGEAAEETESEKRELLEEGEEGEEGEGEGAATEGEDKAAEGEETQTEGEPDVEVEVEVKPEAPKEEEKIEYETQIKLIEHREGLKVELIHTDMKRYTNAEMEVSRKMLRKWRTRDEDIVKTAEAKNNLEGYIYENREKLYEDEDVIAVSTEEEREKQLERLQEAEDWLWEDESPDTRAKFADKLATLGAPIRKIMRRAKEVEDRPEAIEKGRNTIEKHRGKLTKLNERKQWILEEDREKLKTMIDEAEEWLNKKIEDQEAKEPTDTPAFYAKDVNKKMKPFKKYTKELNARKKPKPKKTKGDKKDEITTAQLGVLRWDEVQNRIYGMKGSRVYVWEKEDRKWMWDKGAGPQRVKELPQVTREQILSAGIHQVVYWAGVYADVANESGGQATITQHDATSVTATNPEQDWSPAQGTVFATTIKMTFGESELTGSYYNDKITWDNGATWTLIKKAEKEKPAGEGEGEGAEEGEGQATGEGEGGGEQEEEGEGVGEGEEATEDATQEEGDDTTTEGEDADPGAEFVPEQDPADEEDPGDEEEEEDKTDLR